MILLCHCYDAFSFRRESTFRKVDNCIAVEIDFVIDRYLIIAHPVALANEQLGRIITWPIPSLKKVVAFRNKRLPNISSYIFLQLLNWKNEGGKFRPSVHIINISNIIWSRIDLFRWKKFNFVCNKLKYTSKTKEELVGNFLPARATVTCNARYNYLYTEEHV